MSPTETAVAVYMLIALCLMAVGGLVATAWFWWTTRHIGSIEETLAKHRLALAKHRLDSEIRRLNRQRYRR